MLYVLTDDTVPVDMKELVELVEYDVDDVRVFSIDRVIFTEFVKLAELVLEADILTDLLGVNDPLAALVNDGIEVMVRDGLDEEDTVGLAVDVLLNLDVRVTEIVGRIVFVTLTEKEVV